MTLAPRLIPTEELLADLEEYRGRECVHSETQLTRAVIKGGGIQYRHQCLCCGELHGNPLKHSEVPPKVPARDEFLASTYQKARAEERRNICQKHVRKQKARDNAWWERYHNHMRSPEWAATRDKVLRRANGLCEGCYDKPAVQVHHLTYLNIGNEFLFELVVVCEVCHERLHADDAEEEIDEDEVEEAH